MSQTSRKRCLKRIVRRKADVARVARPTSAREPDNLMTQLFVVHRVIGYRVGITVHVSDRNGT